MEELIFGLPAMVFLLWVSAVFYTVTIIILWRPFNQDRSDLMLALNAFLYGMAFFHIFLGAGFLFHNDILIQLGAFIAFTGSAFTLKFPLSSLRSPIKEMGFYLVLAVAWSLVAWLLITDQPIAKIVSTVLLYMIIVTGFSGLYTIWIGFKAKDNGARVKCLGGGGGMVTCCLIADLLVLLNGVTLLGEILMSVAPVILLTSLFVGRKLQVAVPQQGISSV